MHVIITLFVWSGLIVTASVTTRQRVSALVLVLHAVKQHKLESTATDGMNTLLRHAAWLVDEMADVRCSKAMAHFAAVTLQGMPTEWSMQGQR